jgi:hypothetical protein
MDVDLLGLGCGLPQWVLLLLLRFADLAGQGGGKATHLGDVSQAVECACLGQVSPRSPAQACVLVVWLVAVVLMLQGACWVSLDPVGA